MKIQRIASCEMRGWRYREIKKRKEHGKQKAWEAWHRAWQHGSVGGVGLVSHGIRQVPVIGKRKSDYPDFPVRAVPCAVLCGWASDDGCQGCRAT